MSDTAASSPIEADVAAALAEYDRTRAPEALRNAADQLVRDDGAVPDDPGKALPQARARLRLWIAVLSRFKRDLDPNFDPANPPPWKAPAIIINGEPLPPWFKPEDLKDPAQRKQYDDAVAENARRVAQFSAMFKLNAIHDAMTEHAIASLCNARDTLGLPASEIVSTLQKADLAPRDKAALSAGVAG